jgi:acyl-CoA reductase-like NAD-dependent aldehyde dehydrogenase
MIPSQTELFIDGVWRPATSETTHTVLDPSTGKALTEMACGSRADVDAAVAAARTALEGGPWPRMTPNARRTILLRFAAEVRQSKELIGDLLSSDMGAPLLLTEGQTGAAADYLEYFAGWSDKIAGEVLPVNLPGALDYTLRKPVGVVAAIVPWNAPAFLTVAKIAPALAAGCTIVLKPSELAPLAPLELVRCAERAGLPPGVLNVVTGLGAEVGAPLVEHPGIDMVSFTGGTETGAHVASAAARTFKRVTLELGGKSANVIFADADLDAAAMSAVVGVIMNSGQQCIAGSRVLVQRSVYDQVVEKIASLTAMFKVGLPRTPGIMVGPLINQQAVDRVLGFVDAAASQGRVVVGGERVGGDLADGYFVSPTVVADVDNASDLAQREVFGPVTAVIPFDTTADAVRIANDTPYGLAGGVWTRDLDTAHHMAAQMRCGSVWVNNYLTVEAGVPFGGFGHSGIGREGGWGAIEHFTEVTNVLVALNKPRS